MMPVSSATAQEVAGQHEAAHRVLPAQQGLDRDALAGGEVELRVGTATRSSSRVERAAQRALGEEARRRPACASPRRTARGARHRVAWRGTSRRRRRCSRLDGAVGRPVGDRDADARRHRDLGARQRERLGERLGGAVGELDGLALVARGPRTARRTRRRRCGRWCPGGGPSRSSRRLTATRSSSPVSWPRPSFTSLNRSRSTNSTATIASSSVVARGVRARAPSRSCASARLGRPVRVSCSAR